MGRAIHRRKFHLYGRPRPGEIPWRDLRWVRELDWRRLPWEAAWYQVKEGIALTLAVLLVLSVCSVAWRMNTTMGAQAGLRSPADTEGPPDPPVIITESELAHRIAWLRGRLALQQQTVFEMELRLTAAPAALPQSIRPTQEQLQEERMKLAALRRELVMLSP